MPARPNDPVGRDFGGACILVIDDEAGVRRIVRRMLADTRCRILEAADGVEGLVHLEHEPAIDLVLTDLSMPRASGLAVIEILRLRRPDIPVAVMSGNGAAMRSAPQIPVLLKPFTADELLRLVSELLSPSVPRRRTGRGRREAPRAESLRSLPPGSVRSSP
jgi:CheY-like chemotaxis protein